MQGAGRTDAGVHALGQVAHVKVVGRCAKRRKSCCDGFNDLLPADIVVLKVERAARNFHARRDAVSRSYIYQISTRKQAFTKKTVWWVKEPLNVKAMSAGRSSAGRPARFHLLPRGGCGTGRRSRQWWSWRVR